MNSLERDVLKLGLAALTALSLTGCIFLLPNQPDCTQTKACNPGFVCDERLKVCVVSSPGSGSTGTSSGSTNGNTNGGTTSSCVLDGLGCSNSSDCCSGECNFGFCLVGGTTSTVGGTSNGGSTNGGNTTGSGGTSGSGCHIDTTGGSGSCEQPRAYDNSCWGSKLWQFCSSSAAPGSVSEQGDCDPGQFCVQFSSFDTARCVTKCGSAPGDCPGSSFCLDGPRLGLSDNICMPSCDPSHDCTGFEAVVCNPIVPEPGPQGMCLPRCTSNTDCAAIGASGICDNSSGLCGCSNDTDCDPGGNIGSICIATRCVFKASTAPCTGKCPIHDPGRNVDYCADINNVIIY